MSEKKMWEILVPTVRPNTNGTKFFKLRYHKLWDAFVMGVSDGLTIMNPANGRWVSPTGNLFKERMIPVRIICTREEMEQIVQFTLSHYEQEAVLAYVISDEIILQFSSLKNDS